MNLRTLAAVASAVVLSACGNDAVQSITAAPAGASVKFFNFGVGSPGVNFYANGTKVTAVSSSSCVGAPATDTVCTSIGREATSGTTYSNVAAGGFYTALAPGQYTFTGKTPAGAATDPGITVSTLTATLADGKYYSMFESGIYNTTTKTTDAFIVEDPIPATIDFTVAYVRFVNAISNSQPMQLFAKNTVTTTESAVGGLIAYKAAGDFVALTPAAYDLNVRLAGSGTNTITRTAVSFSGGKVYTVTARGDMTSSATATKPALDVTANR